MKKILFLHQGKAVETFAVANVTEALARLAPSEVRCDSIDLFSPPDSFSAWRLFSSLPTARGNVLQDILREKEPDVVISTSPEINDLVAKIFREGRTRDFRLISLALDFVIGPEWTGALTDRFVVLHQEAAESLQAAGIDRAKISVCGFPVATALQDPPLRAVRAKKSILYLINGARRKAPKLLHRLLENEGWNLTVQVEEGDESLAAMARTRAAAVPRRMQVADSSVPLPTLLAAHDLVISRAGPEVIYEALAAGCPLVAFPFRSEDEDSNFSFLLETGVAVVAERPRAVVEKIESFFENQGRRLVAVRETLKSHHQPDAAAKLARLIVDEADALAVVPVLRALPSPAKRRLPRGEKKLLLCDLHTHTTWSDGRLTVSELIDFYGQREFDCLCITDHLCDPDRLLGRLVNLTGLVIPPGEIEAYFAEIEREKKRAWNRYGMILMAGIEFNKDGYTAKSSAHLLGVDLQAPIDPTLDLRELIAEIQAQGGLAIASHPHEIKSEWGKNTLYLWEHLDEFAPLIDVWEVANRDDIFNPVGLKKLPFMGNSDFHKPKHIQSWKTVLHCEKEAEAIKQCLRVNRDVSLTLYRDHRFGGVLPQHVPLARLG